MYAVLRGQDMLDDFAVAGDPSKWIYNCYYDCFVVPVSADQAARNNAALTLDIATACAPHQQRRPSRPSTPSRSSQHTERSQATRSVSRSLSRFRCSSSRQRRPTSPTSSRFIQASGEIDLLQSDLASDAKWLGHEMGHWAALAANMLDGSGGTHYLLENQRLQASPSGTGDLTSLDQKLSFNEGFADWFGISGAVNQDVSTLNSLPGLGPQQVYSYEGKSILVSGGAGEDEELSVARILWGLERGTDFEYGPAAVFAIAQQSGGTLFGVWQEMLSPSFPENVSPDLLSRLFANENVAPEAGSETITGRGATFDFWLPITTQVPQEEAALTFSEFTVEVRGARRSRAVLPHLHRANVLRG